MYKYKMAYEIISTESAEEGDAEERGWEVEESEEFDTLEELLKDNKIMYQSWLEWSSSDPNPAHDWLISAADEDMRTSNFTTYHLWIKRSDGSNLSKEEFDKVNALQDW